MKIPIKHYEEIDAHEITKLATGQTVLARDVQPLPSNPTLQPILLWNGRKRVIKNIAGKVYLVTTL